MSAFRGLRCQLLCYVGFIGVAVSCTGPRDREFAWRLTDGSSLGDAIGSAPEVALLIVDPASCFTCATALGPILAATRDSTKLRIPVRVFWLRPTSAEEDRRLAPFRVRIDGTLDGSDRSAGAVALYLIRGKIVARIDESVADLLLPRILRVPAPNPS